MSKGFNPNPKPGKAYSSIKTPLLIIDSQHLKPFQENKQLLFVTFFAYSDTVE